VSVALALILAAWPDPNARLITLAAPQPQLRKLKVYVDAGHGHPGNEGAVGCYCQREQVHTGQVASHLAFVLAQLGPFEVKLSRKEDAAGKKYPARIAEAETWGADAIVSVHSDVRGEAWAWTSTETETCWRNDQAPGYAVLWSEDGDAKTNAGREKLGRAMARQLNAAGFRAYTGDDYGALYKPDAENLGWIDIRPRKKSVYFLRASKIPTVIVETHHALDPAEVMRWESLETVDAFALAVGNAVVEAAKR
jgi:N-acetylmuramoyl-L-alanine amidase